MSDQPIPAREPMGTQTKNLREFFEGQVLPDSHWVTIDQEMIDRFALATLDPDPMHISPDWAAQHSPFKSTIAFGFLTTGMLTHLLHSSLGTRSEDASAAAAHLNYGFDRLRLVEPVPVGARIRGKFRVASIRHDERGREFFTFTCEIEIEGVERPALVADWVTVRVPAGKL
jgi:acyl dehydratase